MVCTELPCILSGTYRTSSIIFPLCHRTPLILSLRRHHVRTYFMGTIQVIAIIPTSFYFPPTHSCGSIISWCYYTYYTYLGLPKLIYIDLSWAQIFRRNCSHDFVSERPEHITLKRFVHLVANNSPCWTPYY